MQNITNTQTTSNLSQETTYFPIDLGHKTVNIRKWKAKDRKLFKQLIIDKSDNLDKKIIDVLVKSCVKEQNVVLSYEELQYLFIKIREISISDNFDFTYTCKKCSSENKANYKIKDIIGYSWSEYRPIEIFDLQPVKNFDFYNKRIRESDYDENMEFAFHINTIDGKIMKFNDVIEYLENMDVDILDRVLQEFNKMKFLTVNKKTLKCPNCSEDRTFIFDQIPDFFPDTWLK